jgi:hypothetical protein
MYGGGMKTGKTALGRAFKATPSMTTLSPL